MTFNKKYVFALCVLPAFFIALPAWAAFSGGNGTPGNPYIVTTAAELNAVRDYSWEHFKLGNDINLASYLASGGAGYAKWGSAGWLPIAGFT